LKHKTGTEQTLFGRLRTLSSATGEQRVKGLSAPQHVAVEVDSGSAYELVLGLRMLVDREEDPTTYAVGEQWFELVRAVAGSDLLEAIDHYAGGHEIVFGYLLALVAETPVPRDVETFVATLERTSPQDLRRLLLGHRLQTYRGGARTEIIAAAAEGDTEAARTLLEKCLDWQRAPYQHVLSLDPGEAKRMLVQACEGWYESVLYPEERATAQALCRSVRAARALAERLSVEELVDAVTRGIRYSPEPGIERVLLVPHVVSRPWSIFTEADATKIVCYGVAETDITGDAPPDPLVAAYKALGDETRLRILRRLADGPATLHELTQLMNLAKSTVHGHLLVLRTAGLVVADISKKTGYTLRRETLAESAALLETYLEGTEE
jgi:DNA-binding transcriptional ArsR family regulator